MDELRQLLHNLDERVETRVQAIRADRNWWPCQRGCDHCCRHLAHPPELSTVEWMRVDEAIAQLPALARFTVEQKIDALLQQVAEGTLTAFVACPYLDEQEGACLIYDSRPIACRTYGFFVGRNQNQYCQQIETEIEERGEDGLVWGNAESVRQELEQMSGAPISFEAHYRDSFQGNQSSY